MARLHQKKEVNKALGFRIKEAGGSSHAALILLCPEASTDGHKLSDSPTPRDEGNEADKIRRFVRNCYHKDNPPA